MSAGKVPTAHAQLIDLFLQQIGPISPALRQLLANQDNGDMCLLAATIESDPVLSMRLLAVANSAFYGLASRVSSITRACVIVGVEGVRQLALALMVADIARTPQQSGSATQQLWKHVLATAIVARLLARHLRQGHPEEAFTSALLHDLGKFVWLHVHQDRYHEMLKQARDQRTAMAVVERQSEGIDHAQLGGILAEQMGLPSTICQTIARHHQIDNNSDALTITVDIANTAAKLAGYPGVGGVSLDTNLADKMERLGVTAMELSEIIAKVPEQVDQLDHKLSYDPQAAKAEPLTSKCVTVNTKDSRLQLFIKLAVATLGYCVGSENKNNQSNIEICCSGSAQESASKEAIVIPDTLVENIDHHGNDVAELHNWLKDVLSHSCNDRQ